MGEMGSDTTDDVPDPKSVTYIDYEDPWSFTHNSSGAPHIRKLSQNAWVGCGGDVYLLELLGKGYIRIEPVEATDEGPYTSGLPVDPSDTTSPYRLRKSLDSHLHSCDLARRDCLYSQDLSFSTK